MAERTGYDRLVELAKELQRAERRSMKACQVRQDIPPGSSRAKVTTVNARWMRAAEARDQLQSALAREFERLGLPLTSGRDLIQAYIKGATEDFEPASSDFMRGYETALRSLSRWLDGRGEETPS